jgi:hypothetical protein
LIYQIVTSVPITNSKGKQVNTLHIPQEGYSNRKSAEKKIAKKYSDREVRIVVIPDEITIGLTVYNEDGTEYGTILEETNSFWYLKRPSKQDLTICLKESFEDKFINGKFFIKEGEVANENN